MDARNQFALCNRALARCGSGISSTRSRTRGVRGALSGTRRGFDWDGERGAGRAAALRAYLECRRCDVDGVDAEECDGAIEALPL